jgi:hypothetical protein
VELAILRVTAESTLIQDEEPTAADLDGEVVLLSVRAGSYFGFNRVATEIWQMLASPCRVNQIFALLSEAHDVDEKILAEEVLPFLQTLADQRLVRLIES